jgi:hypothetical protein
MCISCVHIAQNFGRVQLFFVHCRYALTMCHRENARKYGAAPVANVKCDTEIIAVRKNSDGFGRLHRCPRVPWRPAQALTGGRGAC